MRQKTKGLVIPLVMIFFVLTLSGCETIALINSNSFNHLNLNSMQISSPSFLPNAPIPDKFTCVKENVSPELNISGAPENAVSLLLIVDDPDAPMGTWTHWLLWNISPKTTTISENSHPGTDGLNDFKKSGYDGPCPPGGTHHYNFKIYALDTMLDVPQNIKRVDLENEISSHIIDKAELIGIYSKK